MERQQGAREDVPLARCEERARQRKSGCRLDAGLEGRDIVVAIEFQIVEGGGDAKPAGHGGRFDAGNASFTDDDYISAAHRPADQDDFGSCTVVCKSKLAANALTGPGNNCQAAIETKGRQIGS